MFMAINHFHREQFILKSIYLTCSVELRWIGWSNASAPLTWSLQCTTSSTRQHPSCDELLATNSRSRDWIFVSALPNSIFEDVERLRSDCQGLRFFVPQVRLNVNCILECFDEQGFDLSLKKLAYFRSVEEVHVESNSTCPEKCFLSHLVWNSLPLSVRRSKSLSEFRSALKTHLFRTAYSLS